MKLVIVAAAALVSTIASGALAADPVFSCHSDKQRLEVYQTTTGYKGQLNSLYGSIPLDCTKAFAHAGNFYPLWNCAQDNATAGRILVNVSTGGVTGLTTTYVSQEAIQPTPGQKGAPTPAPMTPVSFICL